MLFDLAPSNMYVHTSLGGYIYIYKGKEEREINDYQWIENIIISKIQYELFQISVKRSFVSTRLTNPPSIQSNTFSKLK